MDLARELPVGWRTADSKQEIMTALHSKELWSSIVLDALLSVIDMHKTREGTFASQIHSANEQLDEE